MSNFKGAQPPATGHVKFVVTNVTQLCRTPQSLNASLAPMPPPLSDPITPKSSSVASSTHRLRSNANIAKSWSKLHKGKADTHILGAATNDLVLYITSNLELHSLAVSPSGFAGTNAKAKILADLNSDRIAIGVLLEAVQWVNFQYVNPLPTWVFGAYLSLGKI